MKVFGEPSDQEWLPDLPKTQKICFPELKKGQVSNLTSP